MDWIGLWDRGGVLDWMSMDSPRTSIDQWIGLDGGIDVMCWVGCPWMYIVLGHSACMVLGHPEDQWITWIRVG